MEKIIEEIIKMTERNDEYGIEQLIEHFEEGMFLATDLNEYERNKIMKNMCVNELRIIKRRKNND